MGNLIRRRKKGKRESSCRQLVVGMRGGGGLRYINEVIEVLVLQLVRIATAAL